MADYFLCITQCIQYVQAKVEDGDGTPQIQLNRRQCVYLAHELLKLSQFLQDKEVHHLGLEEGIPRMALLHLHAAVKRAQMLVEGCCCENSSWLATEITMGDTKEEFIAILLDLHQWKFVLGMAMCASAGVSEKAELQQLWETGEEGYQSWSKRNSKMQIGIRDAARQDREELLEKIVNSIIEDERGVDYIRGIYLKAWLNPGEVNPQNVEELKAHSISGDMETVLGRGGSGSVVKGKWLGQEVAFKIQENIDPTEATVLGKLQHPNIVRLFHYWEHAGADCPRSCIVMELMPRDLRKHIVTLMGRRSKLPSTTREGEAGSLPFLLHVAIDTMLQVAQAMRELHERGLMHRDLKTSNILVKPVHEGYLELHSEGYLEVKLADFGSAKTYANSSQTKDLTRNQGTAAYGAPEIFEKEKIIRERNFPPKADVWSFGMTCSEILTGAAPFAGDDCRTTLHARMKKDGLRPDLPEDCPWYLEFCIRSCWELVPQKRPSFSDLCKMLRHAKLMSLGLIDEVDVKCLFWYETSAGVLKSGVHLLQAQEEAKKSRSILGGILYNLLGAEGSSKSQSQKPPACGAEVSAKLQMSSGRDSLPSFKLGDVLTPGLTWRTRRNHLKLQQLLDKCEIKTTFFAYSELVKATQNFDMHMQLGEGAFSVVYKGILLDGSAVAVKRYRSKFKDSFIVRKAKGEFYDDFLNEVTALASLKHQNLVTLQGVCIHGDMRLLVCEYVGSSNLFETLFELKNNQPMTWPMRFNICLGVAQGLHYLHAEVNPRIIHRDISAKNVLLDLNLQPKISDLGVAYFVPKDQSHVSTVHIVGTRGYFAPEYAMRGQLSDKVDVYSFGVLVLEVVSGRRILSFDVPGDETYLLDWARKLNEEGRLMELVDSTLLTQHEEEGEVQRVLSTALACVQTIAGRRPTMAQVLGMFQGKIEIPKLVVDETNEILDDDFHIGGSSVTFVDEESQVLDLKPTIFDYTELQKATQNFHPDMKLGEGGFGAVDKGVLPDASVVAVKQLLFREQKSVHEFSNEVALVSRAKHRNLVDLKGYCLLGDRRMLVYEFVDNSDLAVTLFEHKGNKLVTWPTRFNICLGVAQGLHYLHSHMNPRIIHQDIKASNVLLDVNLHPKISDFGLAMLLPDDNIPQGTTIQIGGTIGYMAPEYATLGQISDKVDVYSFGVLVLEVVSGRRNISFDLPGDETYLVNWAWKLNAEGRLMELVDPTLLTQDEEEGEMQMVLSTALACVQRVAGKRPTMAQVLGMFSMR